MDSNAYDPAQACVQVQGYERRDLAHAQSLLTPGFRMVFPGGHRFDSLEILVERTKGRYRSAKKRYDRHEAALQTDGSVVVYCYGTLHGELNDGSNYEASTSSTASRRVTASWPGAWATG